MNEQPQLPNESPPSLKLRDKKRTKRHLFLILLLVAGVAIVIAATIAVYFLLFNKPASLITPSPVVSQEPTKQIVKPKPEVNQATLIVDEAKQYIDSNFRNDFPQLTAKQNKGKSPAYKVADANFYVSTKDGQTLEVVPEPKVVENRDPFNEKNIAQPLFKSLRNYLVTRKYTHTYTWPGETDTPIEEYESSDTICELSPSYVQVDLSCANKKDYSAAVKKLQPFADAMAADNKLDENTILSDLSIKDSPVRGYQSAVISVWNHRSTVGGFAGLFYKSSSSHWRYFTGVQSLLNCSDYSTRDLKNAFAGELCYDNDIQQKVQAAN